MKVWAITGGIACGKSTVAAMLSDKGNPVASADTDARAVLDNPDVRLAVQDAFPDCFVDGNLDRGRLAGRIYEDPDARQRLNRIMHPAVRHRMRETIARWRENPAHTVAFYEVPLLFEGGLENWFDGVLAVVASPKTQADRLRQREIASGRPPLDDDALARRLAAQMDPAEKARRANAVVETDGSLADVARQVDRFLDSGTID